MNQNCPINGDQHRFFVAGKTYEVYELTTYEDDEGGELYRRVEWAVLICNCSALKKLRVTEEQ